MRGVTRLTFTGFFNIWISTHTPHARRDRWELASFRSMKFQLTRLMRGVTSDFMLKSIKNRYFNSHASCEAWLITYNTFPVRKTFQLTRLMRGVTSQEQVANILNIAFQLTRLMRGVTNPSVYALLTLQFQLTRLMRGVTCCCFAWIKIQVFQLTRLMRGVTHS